MKRVNQRGLQFSIQKHLPDTKIEGDNKVS